MSFDTEITVERADDGEVFTGPLRSPAQMLADQSYGGHTSVHDDATAERLGLAGAPIEGPTHFSQIDPLAVRRWGQRWFEEGCVSSHFLNMVIEGDAVIASLRTTSPTAGRITAAKSDGTPVLEGTATVGPDDATELDERRQRALADPGQLYIVDQLEIGMSLAEPTPMTMDFDEHNGDLYPFTLAEKLEKITERSSWYADGGGSPWGRPIVPTEMISVLAHKGSGEKGSGEKGSGGGSSHFPVRGPAVGLFVDLQVRYVNGPVFVGQAYDVVHTVVGIGQTRRVESYWTESTISDAETGVHTATVLLHQGVFKASFAGHPDGAG